MRLLQIRFQNLNSLVGEWEIDLTHPAFTSDGIFAITGPTGAGKTTILDAICLALYGRTPRLSRVTKSENEIMSRHTGECFAEVTFETQAGVFRCHWSQRRARRKPDGELQSPKHEIADVGTSQIMETKLRGVATQIELATGMDFERFTRSMLLAQGGFAAFLQAGADERAPILEQITGTAIYSQLSICVHERRAQERRQLDCLLAEMAGMRLLSEDEALEYHQRLERALPQEAIINQQIEQIHVAINWLDKIQVLSNEKQAFDEAKHALSSRQLAFAPQLEKLSRARLALELAGEYREILSTRHERTLVIQNHADCQQALPEYTAVVTRAEDDLKHANTCLANAKREQKESLPILRCVRELDTKLHEKLATIHTAKASLVAIETNHSNLQTQHSEDLQCLDIKKLALLEVDFYLTQNITSAKLIEDLSGIQSRFKLLRERDEKLREKVSELSALEAKASIINKVMCEKSALLETSKIKRDVIHVALAQQKLQLENIRGERTATDWRGALIEIKDKQNHLKNANTLVGTIADSTRKLNDIRAQHKQMLEVKHQLEQSIWDQIEQIAVQNQEMQLLENQLSQFTHIMTFNDARHQLQENVPCPLCGSKEHPFAEGDIPHDNDNAAALKTIRSMLNLLNTTLSDLKIKQGSVNKDIDLCVIQQKEITARMTVDNASLQEQLSFLSISETDLDTCLQIFMKDEEKIVAVVIALDEHEKEIEAQRICLEKENYAVTQSERENTEAIHHHDMTEQTIVRVKKEVELAHALYHKAYEDGLADVRLYGFSSLSLNSLDTILNELTLRRDQWLVHQAQKNELTLHTSTLQVQLEHQAGQIALYNEALKRQKHDLNALISQQKEWQEERAQHFEDKNPDEEENRLTMAIDAADKCLNSARSMLNAAEQNRANLINQIESHQKAITHRDLQLKKIEPIFQTQLTVLGFRDEASYEAACLPEDIRNNLIQQARQLEIEQTKLDARHADKSTQLNIELKKNITTLSHDVLAHNLTTQMQQLRDIQQEINGVKQRLYDNELIRQKQTAAAHAMDAQKRECLRWDKLHELIGSADGKKYRNFAQGLTFEMMLGHANRQLQKMTDRYLLIRNNSQPLDLNVIDNYQAGEIRSTKNLSGGESFIVSLALALGLSHMSSKNVRVDSLFLDEGFGTLDEDALDTALETLAGLQQDGKLIGVISHISTLKERISTQIQIRRHMGGRSVISGPGCYGHPER